MTDGCSEGKGATVSKGARCVQLISSSQRRSPQEDLLPLSTHRPNTREAASADPLNGQGIIMTSADSVHLLTLEARGVLSPPDRIHTQARLTPDNQEQRPSRRRECRKAVSSAPSEFTLANGAPGPCPEYSLPRVGAGMLRSRPDPPLPGFRFSGRAESRR